jgi:hypothetical protein
MAWASNCGFILFIRGSPEDGQIRQSAHVKAKALPMQQRVVDGQKIQPHEAKYLTSKQPSVRITTLDLHVTPPGLVPTPPKARINPSRNHWAHWFDAAMGQWI